MTITYHVGDTRAMTAHIPDGSVSLVASSPPFICLRSYLPADHPDKGLEIGSEPDPATFLDTLLALTEEWGRVLAPWGSIAIELGDTYAASPNQRKPDNDGALDKSRWLRGERDDGVGRPASGSGPGWPRPKSLALIPQLYATSLAYGRNILTGQPMPGGPWLVRNVIVWHRPNPAVGALGDKFRPSTSYITVATKSAKRWFDLTAVRTAPANGLLPGQSVTNGLYRGHPDETSSTARPNCVSHAAGAPPLDTWLDEYDSHDTWTLTTQPSKLSHYAMWPAKLAERLILSMCPAAVCRQCGEPRRRVEGAAVYQRTDSDRVPARLAQITGHRIADGVNQHSQINGANTSVIRQAPTLGWSDCGHDDYAPGVVFDPFAGTSTTMCVAELHGRDAIGVDLDARNRELMPRRMEECRRALFGTQPEIAGQLGMFEGEGAA